jgi:hypothetical protein
MTREEFNQLYLPDIKKRDYDRIVGEIDERFDEIVRLVFPYIARNSNWYGYSNLIYEEESSSGYFDPYKYKQEICVGGDNSFPEPFSDTSEGNGCFPTRWLWTDNSEIEKEYKKLTENSKAMAEAEKQAKKRKREELKEKKEIIQRYYLGQTYKRRIEVYCI